MQIDFPVAQTVETTRIQSPRPVSSKIEPTEGNLPQIELKSVRQEDESDVEMNLKELQEAFAPHDISLKFSRDRETNALVVELINQKTGEALRQMPSEVSLKLAAELGKLQGLIYDRKA